MNTPDTASAADRVPFSWREQESVSVSEAMTSVSDFLQTAGNLTLSERQIIVDQAILLLEQNYVHLPLKVAMHAVNPVQRLRLVRARLGRQTPATMEAEWLFHREMLSTFLSVRDLHTNYLLPAPFNTRIAFLPFLIEKATDNGQDHYLVTHLAAGVSAEGFGPGAKVTHWNGTPIARAVELNGLAYAGSNRAANLARGLDSLTLRPLLLQLPPDETWVDVTYVGLDQQTHEFRTEWVVTTNLPPMADLDSLTLTSTAMGLDLEADERARAKKLLYAPAVVELESGQSSAQLDVATAVADADVATTMPGVFRARSVDTAHGTFGHLRIFTFSVDDPEAFRDEFARLAAELPQEGLIVDVRDNGGGHIYASEFTLQTMTPRHITPEPVQFIATPLNLRICQRHHDDPTGQIDLGPWYPSLDQAVETGAEFSVARPITPEDGANALGQTYHGPVVLVTDARCYSATDIFAAGWADHELGPILGVDDRTGAGGANVWQHGLLKTLMEIPTVDPTSPYRALPKGANMRVSIRRTLRVGELSGTPVEDLGVQPDHLHALTSDDLLADNTDLLDRAGELLAALPVRRLRVTSSAAGADVTVQLDTRNLDRADLYLDGRPVDSIDITGNLTTVTVPDAAGSVLRVEGFADGQLVAARRVGI